MEVVVVIVVGSVVGTAIGGFGGFYYLFRRKRRQQPKELFPVHYKLEKVKPPIKELTFFHKFIGIGYVKKHRSNTVYDGTQLIKGKNRDEEMYEYYEEAIEVDLPFGKLRSFVGLKSKKRTMVTKRRLRVFEDDAPLEAKQTKYTLLNKRATIAATNITPSHSAERKREMDLLIEQLDATVPLAPSEMLGRGTVTSTVEECSVEKPHIKKKKHKKKKHNKAINKIENTEEIVEEEVQEVKTDYKEDLEGMDIEDAHFAATSLVDNDIYKKGRIISSSRSAARKIKKELDLSNGIVDDVTKNSGPHPSLIPKGYKAETDTPLILDHSLLKRRVMVLWDVKEARGWFLGTICGQCQRENANYLVKYDRLETGLTFLDGIRPTNLSFMGNDAYGVKWILVVSEIENSSPGLGLSRSNSQRNIDMLGNLTPSASKAVSGASTPTASLNRLSTFSRQPSQEFNNMANGAVTYTHFEEDEEEFGAGDDTKDMSILGGNRAESNGAYEAAVASSPLYSSITTPILSRVNSFGRPSSSLLSKNTMPDEETKMIYPLKVRLGFGSAPVSPMACTPMKSSYDRYDQGFNTSTSLAGTPAKLSTNVPTAQYSPLPSPMRKQSSLSLVFARSNSGLGSKSISPSRSRANSVLPSTDEWDDTGDVGYSVNGIGLGVGLDKKTEKGLKRTGAAVVGIPQSITLDFVGNKETNF